MGAEDALVEEAAEVGGEERVVAGEEAREAADAVAGDGGPRGAAAQLCERLRARSNRIPF